MRTNRLFLAGAALALAGLTGCQTWFGGMTLPSGRYLEHYPQYFPPDPQQFHLLDAFGMIGMSLLRWLRDTFGLKHTFLGGMVIAIIGSAFCAMADQVVWLAPREGGSFVPQLLPESAFRPLLLET